MFDMQSRKYATDPLPAQVLGSISAYYRRVTTEAYPMNWLVRLVMWLTLLSIVAEIVKGVHPCWIGWVSLALAGGIVVISSGRTVPNARRLGGAQDTPEMQSTLARAVCRDHLLTLAGMSLVLGLQLMAR